MWADVGRFDPEMVGLNNRPKHGGTYTEIYVYFFYTYKKKYTEIYVYFFYTYMFCKKKKKSCQKKKKLADQNPFTAWTKCM